MMSLPRVYFTSGDKHGWAIDEDLRQLRDALKGVAEESSLARAGVVHSPFWMALDQVAPAELACKFVIAHADNPPFFYVKQPEFALAQQWVNLWVARSKEAFHQFQALGLPVTYVPYAIDTRVFRPLVRTADEKKSLRRRLGLPEDAYLIANFHRDSEGGNLLTPKTQKAPELFLGILQRLHQQGRSFVVLLAGPRRHWLRQELTRAGIPFHFVGEAVETDDFGLNILSREVLNQLYAAADLYIVPSRWEGGPQSVMEAAACRCPILSTPVGLAKDILAPQCLFRTAEEGAALTARQMDVGAQEDVLDAQFNIATTRHSADTLPGYFREIYRGLPVSQNESSRLWSWPQAVHALRRRLRPRTIPQSVTVLHTPGRDADLDEILREVGNALARHGLTVSRQAEDGVPIVCGTWDTPPPSRTVLQFVASGSVTVFPHAVVVAPSVQDLVNLRAAGIRAPGVTIPWIFSKADQPLVVGPDDTGASVRVWRALQAGQPVLYPQDSAYYEQVFHAGLSYADDAERQKREPLLQSLRNDFQKVLVKPSRAASAQALLKLLSLLSSVPARNR